MTLFISFKNLIEYNKNCHYLDVCKIVYSKDVLKLLIIVKDVQSVIYDITDVYTVFFKKCGYDGIEIPNGSIMALEVKEGD